jgi:protein arginine N-methyltransferase 1
MFEPLVDVVDPHQVVSHPCTILEIDIMTATVSDLAFAADFALPLHRTDFVHALVAYFDVTFSCCHKPVVMPTAPHCKPTHWKQTVFYLQEPLVASAGDEIHGRVVVRPNEANHRDLEIVIDVTLDGAKTDGPVTQRAEYRLR